MLGGRSGASRDATMRQLLADYVPRAYAGARRTGPILARTEDVPPRLQPLPPKPAAPVLAAATPLGQADMMEPDLEEEPGSASPGPARIRPAVIADTPRPKASGPVAAPSRRVATGDADAIVPPKSRPGKAARPAVEAAATGEGGPVLRWIQGPAPVTAPATKPARTSVSVDTQSDTTSAVQLVRTKTFLVDEASQTVTQVAMNVPAASPAQAASPPAAAAPPMSDLKPIQATTARTGWIIQIGATDSEPAARKLLDKAKSSATRALASAEAVHRERRQERRQALARALCRVRRPEAGAGRLHRPQVARVRLHGRPPLKDE